MNLYVQPTLPLPAWLEHLMNDDAADRALWPAVLRGIRCRCPRCGEGHLYRRYLKVVERCEHCNLELGKLARMTFRPTFPSPS